MEESPPDGRADDFPTTIFEEAGAEPEEALFAEAAEEPKDLGEDNEEAIGLELESSVDAEFETEVELYEPENVEDITLEDCEDG